MSPNKINAVFKDNRITKNPFLLFLPFLLFYAGYILFMNNSRMWGDEIRHYNSAINLLKGFYSPPPPNISLETGPGYPLLMSSFIALHLPFICIKLMNAVFQYLSIICLFKALQHVVSFKSALIVSIFWGCYYNFFDFMAVMYAESLTIFLTCMLLLFLMKASGNEIKNPKKYFYLAGFTLGYLALTKVIFGYIIVFMLIANCFLWIMNRSSANYRNIAVMLLIAFATTLPYLIYTYQLTGRIFYWGTSGGNNLYWMSNTVEGEYGDWLPTPEYDSFALRNNPNAVESRTIFNLKYDIKSSYTQGMMDSIKVHHKQNFDVINRYKGLERDDAFKSIAIDNIKSRPDKYLINWICNVGRILFNFPYSYTIQKPTTLFRLPLSGTIVVLIIYCLFPSIINWRRIPFPIRFMLFFTLIYLGASSLASAETRMFTVAVPILLVWIAFVITRSITVKTKVGRMCSNSISHNEF